MLRACRMPALPPSQQHKRSLIFHSTLPSLRSLLREREAELHALAQALIDKETLTQAEIKAILAGLDSADAGGSGGGGSLLEEQPGRPLHDAAPAPEAAAAAASVMAGPAAGGDSSRAA